MRRKSSAHTVSVAPFFAFTWYQSLRPDPSIVGVILFTEWKALYGAQQRLKGEKKMWRSIDLSCPDLPPAHAF